MIYTETRYLTLSDGIKKPYEHKYCENAFYNYETDSYERDRVFGSCFCNSNGKQFCDHHHKMMTTPDYFKMTDQQDFECTLSSCRLYRDEGEVCKSCRTEKNLCVDCWEWAMDALAPWNQESPENYYKEEH